MAKTQENGQIKSLDLGEGYVITLRIEPPAMNSDEGEGRAVKGLSIRLAQTCVQRSGDVRLCYDLDIPAGSFVTITGPSGVGKSTLLELIAGFVTPECGRVFIGEEDVTCLPPGKRPVSMLFQDNNLFAHLDAFTNAGLGLNPTGRFSAEEREKIHQIFKQLGLLGLEKRLPAQLSGGQRQRVALARILLRDSPVILLDEPYTGLDVQLRIGLEKCIQDMWQKDFPTIMMVAHMQSLELSGMTM